MLDSGFIAHQRRRSGRLTVGSTIVEAGTLLRSRLVREVNRGRTRVRAWIPTPPPRSRSRYQPLIGASVRRYAGTHG